MPITEMDINEIQAKINPLVGQRAWGVALGVGSFITLEFGEPSPLGEGQKRTHGEWHLWVYCCAWRLDQGNQVLAASEDARPKLEETVKHLEGLTLQSVQLLPPALETVFNFEGGVSLHLFPIFSEDFEHWMLYTPDGNVLTAGPGTSWAYKNATEIPA